MSSLIYGEVGVAAQTEVVADPFESVRGGFERLFRNVSGFVRGKDEVVRLALVCLFAEGHLLIEDVPGVAKTSLAKAISSSLADGTVARIQFTPDLLPSDVTGTSVFRPGSGTFEFRPGPVFANVLLADEINRASPKTQAALLEVMAEGHVTVDGAARPVPRPFLCVATQNPVDHQGTYFLPEAQLDRFMMMLRVGYPAAADESGIIADGLAGRRADLLPPVMDFDELSRLLAIVRDVHVASVLRDYIVAIAAATRAAPQLSLAVSPRGSIALARACQALAAIDGRAYATADDVKALAGPVLAHRLVLTPDARAEGRKPAELLATVLDTVAVPPAALARR
jgi:MoxR-like ATPase